MRAYPSGASASLTVGNKPQTYKGMHFQAGSSMLLDVGAGSSFRIEAGVDAWQGIMFQDRSAMDAFCGVFEVITISSPSPSRKPSPSPNSDTKTNGNLKPKLALRLPTAPLTTSHKGNPLRNPHNSQALALTLTLTLTLIPTLVVGAYYPGLAVDGSTLNQLSQGSCTHTTPTTDTDPWWRVDLGASSPEP